MNLFYKMLDVDFFYCVTKVQVAVTWWEGWQVNLNFFPVSEKFSYPSSTKYFSFLLFICLKSRKYLNFPSISVIDRLVLSFTLFELVAILLITISLLENIPRYIKKSRLVMIDKCFYTVKYTFFFTSLRLWGRSWTNFLVNFSDFSSMQDVVLVWSWDSLRSIAGDYDAWRMKRSG